MARSDPAERWHGGLEYALDFWDRWFASRGLQWPDEYRKPIAADTPLQPELAELLGRQPDRELRPVERIRSIRSIPMKLQTRLT